MILENWTETKLHDLTMTRTEPVDWHNVNQIGVVMTVT